jgi:O-antigen biosynthesis protein
LVNGLVGDFACGTAYGMDLLTRNGAKYVGVDISRQTLATIKYKSGLIQANLEHDLPFAPNSFDWIVSFETIEHLAQADTFLKEVSLLLKPGGGLLLSTPNKDAFTRTSDGFLPENKYHHKEYTFNELNELILKHFRYVEYYSQGSLTGDEVSNPSSTHARLNRLIGLITGNQTLVTKIISEEIRIPRYYIAVCSDEIRG